MHAVIVDFAGSASLRYLACFGARVDLTKKRDAELLKDLVGRVSVPTGSIGSHASKLQLPPL